MLYPTREKAAAAWLRRAKLQGIVVSSGGGWWRLAGRRRPVGQGLIKLSFVLEQDGRLRKVDAGFLLESHRVLPLNP